MGRVTNADSPEISTRVYTFLGRAICMKSDRKGMCGVVGWCVVAGAVVRSARQTATRGDGDARGATRGVGVGVSLGVVSGVGRARRAARG